VEEKGVPITRWAPLASARRPEYPTHLGGMSRRQGADGPGRQAPEASRHSRPGSLGGSKATKDPLTYVRRAVRTNASGHES
jgi:hypothetical protein